MPTVPSGRLGPAGPSTSLFGLGSWNTWDRMGFDDVVALIGSALDAGVTLFDVAHYNMGPHAERSRTDLIFGEAIRAAGVDRSRYQLCGKLWLWEYPAVGFAEQMRTSLGRIGVDRADAVVVGDYHERPDMRRLVAEVSELVRAGRFDAWGVNNWPAADLGLALDIAEREGMSPPAFAQLKYGVARRSMAEGQGYGRHFSGGRLGLQASDIFEGGVLIGKPFPGRKIGADPGGIRDAIRRSADAVAGVAAGFAATPAQAAIAFCLGHPSVTNVLFGVTSQAQLTENLGALRLWREHGPELRAALEPLWLDRAVPGG